MRRYISGHPRYSTSRLLILITLLGTLPFAYSESISDPVGDFLPSYTGPQNGDMDVIHAEVTFTGSSFIFRSTLNGTVGTTPGSLFAWGVDRGQGTPRFGALHPDVLFDSVFAINPDGTGSVIDLINSTNTPVTSISIAGNMITGIISADLLPSQGFAFADYTVSLWPRIGFSSNNLVSDFAPDSNAGVSPVPEPLSFALAFFAFLAMGSWRGLRRLVYNVRS